MVQDKMFFTMGPLLRQYVIVITVNLGIFCTGLGLGWTSPVLVALQDETNPVFDRPVTEQEGAWIVSIGILFGFFLISAYLLSILLVNWLGRKISIAIGYIPKICAGFIYIFATEVWHLYVGRILNASADSLFFSIVPMYASEIASKEIRGSLGTMLQVMCSLGIVSMYSFGPFVGYINLNIIFTCVTIVSFIPLLMLPDSPYYLYIKGKTTECEKVLKFLRDTDNTVEAEMKDYEIMKNDKSGGFRKELLKNKIFIKGLILALCITCLTQLAGFNAVTYYLQTVFVSTGTNISPELSAIAVGLIQVFASFVTIIIIDKFGRRPILLTTLAGNAIGMIGLGTFFQVTEEAGREVTGFLNYLPLISIIFYVFCFSAGLGSLGWILLAELFDGSTRTIGVPVASLGNSVFGFLLTLLFPALTGAVGAAATYYIFMANCTVGFLFVLFFLPETKGKTFLEIQVILGGKQEPQKKSEP